MDCNNTQRKPIIAITMGDPAGVGPEIIAKYLSVSPTIHGDCRVVIVGDYRVYQQTEVTLGQNAVELNVINKFDSMNLHDAGYSFLDIPSDDDFEPGDISESSGYAAMQYLITTTELARNREVDAIVTAPVSKAAINRAGYHYGGHTDYFANICGVQDPTMCFWRDDLAVALLTDHKAYKDVPSYITEQNIEVTVTRFARFLSGLGTNIPRIGVLCLNPHCGEEGLLGSEEGEIISPTIRNLRNDDYDVTGPYTPEIGFAKVRNGELDGLLALYHDQGITPFKLSRPMDAVNVSLGLPFVRTSVSHGTAADIAGTGTANPTSLKHAVELAIKLTSNT